MTHVRDALRSAAKRLSEAGVASPIRDARRLLAHVLETDTAHLSSRETDDLTRETQLQFEKLVSRRSLREPVSHLLGYRDFWKSRFKVTSNVLDPRPETELLVELALSEPFARVLDLGTGSGAILISLLLERVEARGVGTDISPEAILIAGENAATLGVEDRITLPLSEWFDDLGGRYDLIVSNPPYIALAEMQELDPEVREHEPRIALTDEGDGLAAYRVIAAEALGHLTPKGRVLVEIGASQGADVAQLFRNAGFSSVAVHRDLDGRDRVVEARISS